MKKKKTLGSIPCDIALIFYGYVLQTTELLKVPRNSLDPWTPVACSVIICLVMQISLSAFLSHKILMGHLPHRSVLEHCAKPFVH
jgi:hypothetical protein